MQSNDLLLRLRWYQPLLVLYTSVVLVLSLGHEQAWSERQSTILVVILGSGHLLNKAFVNILGSKEKWETRKAELIAGKKWAEVIY